MKRVDSRIALIVAAGIAVVIAVVVATTVGRSDKEDVASATATPVAAATGQGDALSVVSPPKPQAPPAPRHHHPTKPVSSLRTPPATGPAFSAVNVLPGAGIPVFSAPGGSRIAVLGDKTDFGSQRTLSIVKTRGAWFGVIAPELGNGVIGWAKYDPNTMQRYWTKYSLRVDLSERRLELVYGDQVVGSYSVTVGGTGSETPMGRFAVTDGIRFDASPYYGCCAVATTGHQPNLPPGWIGGDRIAIHGTPGPVGLAESHGCLRATNATMEVLMSRIPLATPVFIHA